MYCNKCGAENTDGAKFCTKCGAPLDAKTANTAPTQMYQQVTQGAPQQQFQPVPQQPAGKKPKGKKSPLKIIGIVILVILAIGIFGGGCSGSSDDSDTSSSNTSTEQSAPADTQQEEETAPSTAVIPDVNGQNGADAEQALNDAGFTNITFTSIEGDSVWSPSDWTAQGTDPAAGTEVATDTEITLTVSKCQINVESAGADQYGLYKITGTLTNLSDEDFSYVQLTYDIYDASGVKIGDAYANTSGLAAGATWRFEATHLDTDTSNIASYQLSEVTYY